MKNFDWNTYEALELMCLAAHKNDVKMFNKQRDRFLVSGDDLFRIIANYLTLDKMQCAPCFDGRILSKGRKFYRIRKYDPNTDFSDPKQWTAPPIQFRNQNRANHKGQEALYLADSEVLCLWETHIKNGDKYALATYECIDNIIVGSLSYLNPTNVKLNIASFVLNSFLMAPARKPDENLEVFEYLDNHFGIVNPTDLKIEDGLLLPYKFGVMNKKHQYYELTNQICDVIAKFTPDGIKYSSCYMPLESCGLNCATNNIVLYHSGIEKVKLIGYSIKECDGDYSELTPIKIIAQEYKGMGERMFARFYTE